MERMSMYVNILKSALAQWPVDSSELSLVEYAVSRRVEMLDVGLLGRDAAYELLTAEVAYDRALIKVCEANNVTANAGSFAYPQRERDRLERELADVGIDLTELSRRLVS
jgi:hypothetical protein